MMPKVSKNMVTGGKTRIEKQAFRMEGIAKTKVSSRKKASEFVEIEVDQKEKNIYKLIIESVY